MRTFNILLFLPLLILFYNLGLICIRKVLLTCNHRVAAGCGTLKSDKYKSWFSNVYNLGHVCAKSDIHQNAGSSLDYAHQRLLWWPCLLL